MDTVAQMVTVTVTVVEEKSINPRRNMKLLITLLFLFTLLHAELKVGKPFPTLNLVNQFECMVEVPQKETKYIIFSSQKDISSKIKMFIEFQEKDFLEKNSIVYLSDISKMPTLISKLIALPKMKEFGFMVALIYDENIGSQIDRRKNKITIIHLENQTISKIEFIKPTKLFEIFK